MESGKYITCVLHRGDQGYMAEREVRGEEKQLFLYKISYV